MLVYSLPLIIIGKTSCCSIAVWYVLLVLPQDGATMQYTKERYGDLEGHDVERRAANPSFSRRDTSKVYTESTGKESLSKMDFRLTPRIGRERAPIQRDKRQTDYQNDSKS